MRGHASILAMGCGAGLLVMLAGTAAVGAAPRVPVASRIAPAALARAMAGPPAARPLVLHVGFRVLYRTGHIAGTAYKGPGSKPEGVQALRDTLRAVPRAKPLVLYCGCCPWVDCPNVGPAYSAARSMGFSSVKVLYMPKNFQTDWVDKGYPMETGTP